MKLWEEDLRMFCTSSDDSSAELIYHFKSKWWRELVNGGKNWSMVARIGKMVARICTCLDERLRLMIALSTLRASFALRTRERGVECNDMDRYIFSHTFNEHVQLRAILRLSFNFNSKLLFVPVCS